MIDPSDQQLLVQLRLLDSGGRLVRWPTKQPHRLLALRHLIDKFEPGLVYTEAELNSVLKQWHTFQDWSILRRELVDHRFLSRDPAGREYRVIKQLENNT